MGKFLGFYTLCTKLTDNPHHLSFSQMVDPFLYLILPAVEQKALVILVISLALIFLKEFYAVVIRIR